MRIIVSRETAIVAEEVLNTFVMKETVVCYVSRD